MKSSLKTLAMWLILGIIFIVLITSIIDNTDTKMKYSELITKMENGEVTKIEISANGDKADVTIKGDSIKKEVNIPSLDSFMNYTGDFLVQGSIELTSKSESIWITILSLLTPFGLLIIFFIFWFFIMNSNSQGRKQNNVIRKE